MRWFYRWLASKINNINNDSECVPVGKLRSARADHDLPDGGLNIQIKSAIGGKIVLFRTYDRRNDENYFTTYLIVDGEDFEKSLSRIITLESMKL